MHGAHTIILSKNIHKVLKTDYEWFEFLWIRRYLWHFSNILTLHFFTFLGIEKKSINMCVKIVINVFPPISCSNSMWTLVIKVWISVICVIDVEKVLRTKMELKTIHVDQVIHFKTFTLPRPLRPNTTITWKLIPPRSKIRKNWNPPHWELFY